MPRVAQTPLASGGAYSAWRLAESKTYGNEKICVFEKTK